MHMTSNYEINESREQNVSMPASIFYSQGNLTKLLSCQLIIPFARSSLLFCPGTLGAMTEKRMNNLCCAQEQLL